jgi:hypothetical protein
MKKIPESFDLDEEDIKEAIVDWLNKVEYYDTIDDVDFDITLSVEKKFDVRPGMDDWSEKNIITAKAVKL